jgi:ubiquinone/menaquinone biosynthesis C-methylase UbiE
MQLPQMALLRKLLARNAVKLVSSGAAADIGCGPGYLAIELARAAPGLHVTGVDLSNAMLAQGIENAALAGVAHAVDFRTGDAAALPFPDGSLDLVVSTLSLHHWDDPVSVLDEIARVLRPGGAFLVFDLRRDVGPAPWLLFWFAAHCVVPRALRHVGEPLGSRNAAYTPVEAAALAQASRLTGWRVTRGALWLTIEGYVPPRKRMKRGARPTKAGPRADGSLPSAPARCRATDARSGSGAAPAGCGGTDARAAPATPAKVRGCRWCHPASRAAPSGADGSYGS